MKTGTTRAKMSSSSQKPFRILGLAYAAVVSIGALCAIIYGIVRIGKFVNIVFLRLFEALLIDFNFFSANGDDFIAYKMFDHNPGEASMGPNRSYFYVMLFSSPLLQGIVWLASSIFLAVGILKVYRVFFSSFDDSDTYLPFSFCSTTSFLSEDTESIS